MDQDGSNQRNLRRHDTIMQDEYKYRTGKMQRALFFFVHRQTSRHCRLRASCEPLTHPNMITAL